MKRYRLGKGYIHLITGDGPGKTTSALGLSVRALGNGLKVCIVQFMKNHTTGEKYGETDFFKDMKDITIRQFGTGSFIKRGTSSLIDARLATRGLKFAQKKMLSGKFDIIILDEVNVALDFGLLDIKKALSFIKLRPKNVELILTGRNAPKELYKIADYVVFINSLKHPFDIGIKARKGIEY